MEVSIRPFTEADAPAISALIAASLPELRAWMAWAAAEPQTVDARAEYLRSMIASAAAGADRARAMVVDGAVAGSLGLHRNVGPDAWEIGYWLATRHTGRGIATTAVRLLAAEAFAADPATTHLEIHHASSNTASGAVARRAGFTLVDSVPRARLAPNDSSTEHIWRLTRAAWVAA